MMTRVGRRPANRQRPATSRVAATLWYTPRSRGAIAQLEEHLHGMQGVRGSSPRSSTNRDETADPHPSPARRGVPVSEHVTEPPTRPTSRATDTDRAAAPGSSATTRPPSSRAGRRAGTSSACTRRTCTTTSRPQVLPADDVPVSVGRPAHRPLVHRHADRRARPLPPDARLQRVLPDRLRCLRAAGRERRDQERRATRAPGRCRTSRTCAASSGRWARRSTGTPRSSPPTPTTTAGTSGCSCGSWRRASPTARSRRSTGAPTTGRSPASRSRAPTATAGAAARWSRSATSSSGTCGHDSYADELLDFTGIDWPEPIRIQQTNWIGRSEGAEIVFETAPVRPPRRRRRAARLHDPARHAVRRDVHGPRARAPARRDADRARAPRPRSRRTSPRRAAGPRSSACRPTARRPASPIGADAINPVNGERIPIFVADYVLAGYGTGAIMAVPAHDERDFAFAEKFGLPIRRVVAAPGDGRRRAARRAPTSPTPPASAWSTAASSPGCPPTRAARRSSPTWTTSGKGRARGHLPPARLADQPPALLGHADPGHLLPDRRHRAGPRRGPAGPCCPTPSTTAGSGDEPADPRRGVPQRRPARICGGPAQRETDTMDTFIDSSLVLVSATCRRTRPTGRSTPTWSTRGRRSSSTRAAPSTR